MEYLDLKWSKGAEGKRLVKSVRILTHRSDKSRKMREMGNACSILAEMPDAINSLR
jgi:hypothetical protein